MHLKIKKMSDEELMTQLGIEYARMQAAFRSDEREYNKARAKHRRLKAEIRARQARKESASVE